MADDRGRDEMATQGWTRRELLGTTALGGLAAAAGPLLGSLSTSPAAAQPPAQAGGGGVPAFELDEATIAQLQEGMAAGRYTARSLAERYLERIAALDRQGPNLRSVLETDPDALAAADALDAERKAKGPRGPLHGIPLLLKDNVATAGRTSTTAGSLALAGAAVPREATVAARLREAGAVLLGKTNLSEWANFRSTHSSSGWSGRGGQCRNPYALDRTPSGSSSGSAAAVAGNLIAAAVGSETDGSIVSPSSICSLVGIKPTVGLLSRAGVVPISHTQDSAGPMARTVADAVLLLTAMAGRDERDEATRTSPATRLDYSKFLDPNGLRGARLGVVRSKLFGYSPAADRLAEAALAEMKRQGAVLVDPADIATAGQFDDAELEVLLYEFKADLNRYLADLGPASPVHTLQEVIAFNERERAREMPYFGQELMHMAQAKGPLSDAAYRKALARCREMARVKGIDATLGKHKLDALVAPTGAPAWLIDPVNGDASSGSSSTPAAVAGYPHITVPAGYSFGLPVGVSFIGAAYSEPTLIKLAYSFEQATKHRRAPRFLPTVDLTAEP